MVLHDRPMAGYMVPRKPMSMLWRAVKVHGNAMVCHLHGNSTAIPWLIVRLHTRPLEVHANAVAMQWSFMVNHDGPMVDLSLVVQKLMPRRDRLMVGHGLP